MTDASAHLGDRVSPSREGSVEMSWEAVLPCRQLLSVLAHRRWGAQRGPLVWDWGVWPSFQHLAILHTGGSDDGASSVGHVI